MLSCHYFSSGTPRYPFSIVSQWILHLNVAVSHALVLCWSECPFDSVSLILLSAAAAAVAEKYLSVLQCIHPWLKHCFIVLEGLGLSLLPIWNVSCLSEWYEAARTMDAQCPGDSAPLHCSTHPLSSHFINVRQGKTNGEERESPCHIEGNELYQRKKKKSHRHW